MTLATIWNQDDKSNTKKPLGGYSIVSHGGIGDEHREYGEENRPKNNLSGSCHRLSFRVGSEVHHILVDMWGYQWPGKLDRSMTELSNWVHTVILTHPHMDHIGDFPLAFIDGAEFAGRVYAMPATKDAADISLTDSANILAREHARK